MRKVALAAVLSALVACDAPPDAPAAVVEPAPDLTLFSPVPLSAEQAEGQVLYRTLCWVCHGSSGRGDGPGANGASDTPPPSFHTRDFATATTDELAGRFRTALAEGDPTHPHMKYVVSLLKPDRFRAAVSYIPALSYPPEIPGSAIAGAEIYRFRCAGCHGDDGRGHGRASAALTLMPPADFAQDTLIAAGNWNAVFDRIREGGRAVHGSSMPPWGSVLWESEVWDLVAYIATFQPDVLSAPPPTP